MPPKEPRALWTDDQLALVLRRAVDTRRRGAGSDNGSFKTKILEEFASEVNRVYEVSFTAIQVRTKFSNLKSDYTMFKKICDNSGFGWDPVSLAPTAPDEVWDNYMALHPKAKKFRNQTLPFLDYLDELFSESRATGQFTPLRPGIPGVQVEPPTEADLAVIIDPILESLQTTVPGLNVGTTGGTQSTTTFFNSPPTPVGRPTRADRATPGRQVAHALNAMNTTARELAKDSPVMVVQRALAIVYESFDLVDGDLMDIIDVLENFKKANAFISTPERLRERWIERQLGHPIEFNAPATPIPNDEA